MDLEADIGPGVGGGSGLLMGKRVPQHTPNCKFLLKKFKKIKKQGVFALFSLILDSD